MFLFKGKMGTIFHTGDFRYSLREFRNYHTLYPPSKANLAERAMTIPIDHLIVDATFANPVIEFPSQDEAIISIDSIVQKAKAMKHKIHIFVYTIGKEEIFIRLAQKYKTQVVVDEDRYRKL